MTSPSLSFLAPAADLSTLTDAEFLQSLVWERSADPEIRAAAASGDVTAFVKAWRKVHRVTRDKSTALARQFAPVLWSQAAFPEEAGLSRLLQQACGVATKKVAAHRPVNKPPAPGSPLARQLLSELITAVTCDEPRPFAMLAALNFLAAGEPKVPADEFFRLWRQCLSRLLAPTPEPSDPTIPADVRLIEQGEIPFMGGLVFRDVASSSRLLKPARKSLVGQLTEQTDTDGTPHAELLPRYPLWLAPFVRVSQLMAGSTDIKWSSDQQQLLGNVIDRAISLCRPDGRAALTNGMSLNSLPVLNAAAELLEMGLIGETSEYLDAVRRAVSGKPQKRSRSPVASMPSNQSDWAKFALLRRDWTVESDSVAITHHQPLPQLDVNVCGRHLIHGDWGFKLKLADAVVELAEEWSCVCWQSDPEADYIELQMLGPGNLRVERLVLLSRKERFLFIADSISGAASVKGLYAEAKDASPLRIEFESRLSLVDGLTGNFESQTREARISGNRMKVRVFPLALPQDRVLSTPHDLAFESNQLVLKQVAEGDGLFAPLLFCWDADHLRSPAIWRTLTVAEECKVVRPDVAVGYRLKLDDFQLLITRALKKTGNSRTCLGHHTFNETVIGRFDTNGDLDPILLVE